MIGRGSRTRREQAGRFSPRALGVRNILLSLFSRRRSLPLPRKADLTELDDTADLTEAVYWWEEVSYKRSGRARGAWWRYRLRENFRVLLILVTVVVIGTFLLAGWYVIAW